MRQIPGLTTIALAAIAVLTATFAAAWPKCAAAQTDRATASTPGVNPLLERASELLRAGKIEEAESAARDVVNTEPRNPAAHTLLGVILFQRGHADEAEQELRRALRINPKFVTALS